MGRGWETRTEGSDEEAEVAAAEGLAGETGYSLTGVGGVGLVVE